MMFANLVSLAALAAVANAEHWIFGGSRPIVTTRLDSIVNPDAIGTHVHSIVGASRFKNVYDADDLKKSKCTTIPVQPDKSNYWAPQMYYRDQNSGQLTPIQTGFNIYYLKRNGPKNEPVKAFPPGLRMVAGDTNRRSYNASNFADQAVSYVCLDYSGAHNNDPDWAERPNYFDHNCPNGMRAQVFFPSCWDGKNLDSDDHKSHMAYPVQNYNSGDCPASHPVHLVSLFYEMFVSVDQHQYWGPGSWVLANGDTTGYGHHGDFQNGWDVDLLQNAIDNCPNANGNVMDCPPLAAVFDQASADACVLETELVDENIGLDSPITQLPGCNPIWDGTGTKPACSANSNAAVSLKPAQVPLPDGWSELGCIAEGTSGRALTGASTKAADMTRASCASFCSSKGFKLAAVEFGDECYCDNQVRNGASTNTVTWNQCTSHCAGNENEICGGPQRLTLLTTANPGAAQPSSVSSPAKPSTSANAPSSPVAIPAPSSSSVHTSVVLAAPSVPSASKSSSLVASAPAVPTKSSSPIVSVPAVSTKSSSPIVSVPAVSTKSSTQAVPAPAKSTSSPTAGNGTSLLPLGWSSAGCVSDASARALTGYSFANDAMTVYSCLATCASKGFSMGGLEFGRECYCGNSIQNKQGSPLATSQCNMICAGDKTQTCGGNWALAVFKSSNVNVPLPAPTGSGSGSDTCTVKKSTSKRNVHLKARNFGRAHQHSDVF